MPSSLLSLNAFVCEKILLEKADVATAMRIVEVFSWTALSDVPIDRQGVSMWVYISGKTPEDDDAEHTIDLFLVRPDGQIEEDRRVTQDRLYKI